MIKEFQGRYRFLSNFWLCYIDYQGLTYPSVEHAYQATKFEGVLRVPFTRTDMKPGEAKRLGRSDGIRKDWESVKLSIMKELVTIKFSDKFLGKWLLDTKNEYLQEGNMWYDTFWGVDLRTGQGQNNLGKILMEVRECLTKPQ